VPAITQHQQQTTASKTVTREANANTSSAAALYASDAQANNSDIFRVSFQRGFKEIKKTQALSF
jgi:hypothetical protein